MHSIVLIGDVHDHRERLEVCIDLLRGRTADLVVLAGDVGRDPPWDRRLRERRRRAHDDSVRRVVERAGAAFACPVVFVPGNHDLPVPPDDVAGVNVDRRIVEVAGLSVAGFGGAGPTPYGFPYEWSERDADRALKILLGDAGGSIDLFLSHTPPARTTLDRTARGEWVGSAAVGRWLRRTRPRLFVCGHIHEAWGVEQVHGIPCVNAGALGEPYGQPLAWVVDWSRGPVRIRSIRTGADGLSEDRTWHEP